MVRLREYTRQGSLEVSKVNFRSKCRYRVLPCGLNPLCQSAWSNDELEVWYVSGWGVKVCRGSSRAWVGEAVGALQLAR